MTAAVTVSSVRRDRPRRTASVRDRFAPSVSDVIHCRRHGPGAADGRRDQDAAKEMIWKKKDEKKL